MRCVCVCVCGGGGGGGGTALAKAVLLAIMHKKVHLRLVMSPKCNECMYVYQCCWWTADEEDGGCVFLE